MGCGGAKGQAADNAQVPEGQATEELSVQNDSDRQLDVSGLNLEPQAQAIPEESKPTPTHGDHHRDVSDRSPMVQALSANSVNVALEQQAAPVQLSHDPQDSATPQELQTNQKDMPSQASSTNHSSQITSVLVHNVAGDVVAELKPAPESVADLKDLLARRCGLPFAVLRLLHGDQVLQDEDVLSAHGPHCDVLLVIMRQPQSAEDDLWKTKHKPVGMMDCTVGDQFALDITLLDGRVITVEGNTQEDFITDTKRKVIQQANLPSEAMEDFILVYFNCWMGDEFQLNAFGVPWNGTQLSLESKSALQAQAQSGNYY